MQRVLASSLVQFFGLVCSDDVCLVTVARWDQSSLC